MANKKRSVEVLATIWNCPDDLWQRLVPVLAELDPPHDGHRSRIDPRKALDGIIYRLRTGCQWNHLPGEFGDDSSVHRTMQRWFTKGVFDRIWALLVEACDELGAVDWSWQSIDGSMGKARKGATKLAPIPPIVRKTA